MTRPLLSCAMLASVLLLIMAHGAAWAFGGTSAAAQWVLQTLAAVCAICGIVTLYRSPHVSRPLPVGVLPLTCGLILGAFQLAHLPPEFQKTLSPASEEWRQQLTGVSQSDSRHGETGPPFSLYPAATRDRLALLLLGTVCFGVTAFIQNRTITVFLMLASALGGSAVAFFGLAQKFAWDGRIFWRFDVPAGAGPFASFVNKNNAAGFLLVCLAMAIGAAVWVTHRHQGARSFEARHRRRFDARASVGRTLTEYLAQIETLSLVVLGSLALIVTGILASMSRGGWIALAGATIVTLSVAALSRRRLSVLFAFVPAGLLGLAIVSLIGLNDSVSTRMQTLMDRDVISSSRIPHWRDGVQAIPDFWQIGSGLGTYRFVYPRYQERLDKAWYYHAENQYLETAVEAGIPGLSLLGAMILLVAWASWFLIRRATTPEGYALGFVGIFGLTSQVIHGVADFATFIPAVTVLFAVLCGMVCGEAAAVASERSGRWLILSRSRAASAGYLCALLMLCVFGIAETGCSAMAERSTHPPVVTAESPPAADDVSHQLAELQRRLQWKPDDAELHLQLANAYVMQSRREMFGRLEERFKEHQQLDSVPEETRNSLWLRTQPTALHARAWDLIRAGHWRDFEELRAAPSMQTTMIAAYSHLRSSRSHCPLLPQTHLKLAEVGFVGNSSDWDRRDVARARLLAPADSDVLFRCGLLDLNAGRFDDAAASWKRALTLDRSHWRQIMEIAPVRMPYSAVQFVARVLPDDPRYLIELGQRYHARGEKTAGLVRALGQRATDLIADSEVSDWERLYVLGYGAEFSGTEGAPDYLSEAVDLKPTDLATRYHLANLLLAEGRYEEALSHVRRLKSLDGDEPQYAALEKRIINSRTQHQFGIR